MSWLAPLESSDEARRRKWRQAQRRHRKGQSMSRRAAALKAIRARWERRA